ncbi:MAG: DUF393 domain-containing protein [Flavobacteriales bacterium]|nr:DUF393 domain-containing protein [Flavobacteriales bacterium]
MMDNIHPHIVLFDGECNLCNNFVDYIIRYDKNGEFKFDSLQSTKSKELLTESPFMEQSLSTVVYVKNEKFYNKSTAVLLILHRLHFPLSLAVILLIVPKFIRDWVYSVIAKNRYGWFGKRNTCRIPTEEEKAKFL